MSAKQRDLLLLTLGCAVLFGLRLGARDLWNPNEPIYGEAVVEMAQRADWLVPHVNGLVFGEKPILYYWMAAVASKLFGGVSEWSLRLPCCLAGIATVLGTYVLSRPYAGRARALASAIGVATLFGVFWNARFVQMDILVTATTLWVVIAATRVIDHGASPLPGFLLAGAVAGLGFAAKGPVAWVCPGLTLVAYLAATRRVASVFRWEALAGVAACLAVASPWFLLLYRRGDTAVIAEVLFRQNLQRFVSPWDHQAPWWYYLESFWIDMAPWAFLLPLAAWLPRRSEGERRLALLSWLWIGTIVAFFSFSKSKRSPYLLPVAPAVAVLAGEIAIAFLTDRLDRLRRNGVMAVLTMLAGAYAIGGAVLLVGALWRWHEPAAVPVAILGLVAVIAGALVLVDLARPETRPMVPLSLATATVAIYLAGGGVALPALDAYKSARPFCAAVDRLSRPGDEVASFEFWNWRSEYRYYLGRPIVNLAGLEPLRDAWTGPGRIVLLVEADRLDDARKVIGGVAPAMDGHVGGGTIYVFTNR